MKKFFVVKKNNLMYGIFDEDTFLLVKNQFEGFDVSEKFFRNKSEKNNFIKNQKSIFGRV